MIRLVIRGIILVAFRLLILSLVIFRRFFLWLVFLASVGKHIDCGFLHVIGLNILPPIPCCHSSGGLHQHQFTAIALTVCLPGIFCCQGPNGRFYRNGVQQLFCLLDFVLELLRFPQPPFTECCRTPFILHAVTDDLRSDSHILFANDIHIQTKTVQKLGTQLAFFRIHGANQHKFTTVAVGDTLPLHQILFAGSSADQGADDAVRQQIHFIHIENVAVRTGKNTAGKTADTVMDCPLEVNTANQHILRDIQRQIYHLLICQCCQTPNDGGFCSAFLTAEQDTPYFRVD